MNLQIYKNPEIGSVRAVTVDGVPYFIGKDVASILGYERPAKAILDHVDVEDKDEVPIQDSIGRMQNTPIINESGLYSLILSSKMPNAKKFKRWVTSEVLPAIRKHGLYATDDLINDPDLAIAAFTALKKEREKTRQLEETLAIQNQQITEMKPKASYYDVVLNCKDLISTSAIAKDYGKSAIWMNRYLHEKGIQFKQGDIWLLYQKYAEKGYTSTKTHSYLGSKGETRTKVHTYWTQKGRLFIYDLLKANGILPQIEMEEV
ncbi:phage antirepressor KilAC domain-containing protein [Vagococcus lutrae]|jgi:prophage antirepressor-like protein|uniref:phage antirepressor n=1 Tax=Vagococcus lutrae TaxID=81947 RepID=UPI00288F274E|nr:phage antirepressor KilAC domain-containing protein [Vagococcus lutrae]MDT2812647.1 phage antirepressor KilAC domain-containing protein [Vagococcus lutrae]